MTDKIRKAKVRGIFYPNECTHIKNMIESFNAQFDAIKIDKKIASIIPNALIVPHAGYIYSGFTANFAYRFLSRSAAKRIIVIGPSHHYYFKGISGAFYENIETPCGFIDTDIPYLSMLTKEFNIGFEPKAHHSEHATEVQMPFVRHYLPNAKVIEIVYGDIEAKTLAKIIIALLSNTNNTIIISSDLSHFYPLHEANIHDTACLKAIQAVQSDILKNGCEACGIRGIEAMLIAAEYLRLRSVLLDYKTSAAANGDTKSVVGYMSAMFYYP